MVRKGGRKILWTTEEENTLRRLYKSHTAKEIAKLLNRSVFGVMRKKESLGLRKKTGWWSAEEIERLKEMYKNGRKRVSIARALGRSVHSVVCMGCKLGLKGKALSGVIRKGRKGERIALKIFEKLKWEVKEIGKHKSPFDFVVDTQNGVYAVNVKYGKAMVLAESNLHRLISQDFPIALLFITETGKCAFMPLKIIEASPQSVSV